MSYRLEYFQRHSNASTREPQPRWLYNFEIQTAAAAFAVDVQKDGSKIEYIVPCPCYCNNNAHCAIF